MSIYGFMWSIYLILYDIFFRIFILMLSLSKGINAKAYGWLISREANTNNLKKWRESNSRQAILVHCASLGEFEQGFPVIKSLKERHPSYAIVVSYFSPSGYENTPNHPFIDLKIYSPFDTKNQTKEFLELVRPKMAVFIKNEFWPNLINQLHEKGVPVIFTSTNFTSKSFYPEFFYNPLFKRINCFFVQSEESKQFLIDRGIVQVKVAGDLRIIKAKENVNHPYTHPVLEKIKNPIIVYGSIWREDWSVIKEFIINRPEHFHVVAPHNIQDNSIKFFQEELYAMNNTLLLDTMGELKYLYRYAQMAYIGGAFGKGLHNILEPSVYGIPVIFGSNYQKFEEAKALILGGGAISINSAEELHTAFDTIINLMEKYRNGVSRFYFSHQPNLEIIEDYIAKHIS